MVEYVRPYDHTRAMHILMTIQPWYEEYKAVCEKGELLGGESNHYDMVRPFE